LKNQFHRNRDRDIAEREKVRLTERIISLKQILQIAEMFNLLKPYKVFGLTARGALVVSVLTMSLSFYGIVFSFYSSNPSNSSFFP
jgi:hypothetical protein